MEVPQQIFQMQTVVELKQKLMHTTLELELIKRSQKELLSLLEITWQERDEARKQMQIIVNNLVSSSLKTELHKPMPQVQPQSPFSLPPTKPTSSITGYCNNSSSRSLSPLGTTFEEVEGVLLNPKNVGYEYDIQSLFHDHDHSKSALVSSDKRVLDLADSVIDGLLLAKEKALPPKGRLVEAVIEAGPLLETLLQSGHTSFVKNSTFYGPRRAINAPRAWDLTSSNASVLLKQVNKGFTDF